MARPTPEILERFETHLQNKLQPVPPDPVFVGRLRKRLLTSPDVILEPQAHIPDLVWVFMILSFLVGLMLLVRAIVRMVRSSR